MDTFKCSFNTILVNRTLSVDCYNVIVNSLAMFYARNTWPSRVQVINFVLLIMLFIIYF